LGSKIGSVQDEEANYKVVAILFFREREIARFATREQAEWRAQELNEWAERNPRGYVQYLVRSIEKSRGGE
jgi:hypothetical protein